MVFAKYNFRMIKTLLIIVVCAIGMVSSLELSARDPIKAEQIFENLGFSTADRKKLMQGDLVSKTLNSSSEHELIVAFAFYVKLPADKLFNEIRKQPLIAVDPAVINWALITDGTLEDFKTLELSRYEEERARKYLKAEPGKDLNLDRDEIARFNAIKVPHNQSAVTSVTKAIRTQLLARFQAYRQSGLSGISPYERNQQSTSAGIYLKKATEASVVLKTVMPDFYKVLLSYPENKPEGFEEEFMWINYKAHEDPVFVLSHNLRMADSSSKVFVTVQRHFYVSSDYNAGQSVSGLIPVDDGSGTIIFYVNKVFSDNLTGLGSSIKKSIGSEIMITQLKKLFGKARTEVEESAR
ncbi:hypothetical protein W03_01700 [Nitrosomonas sp. PY1]|uniref:hypothetical protein n=1 Tax=Nitrosomonas sp. PY1 TaxID=1803906 RepID=UPI001FC80A75|nr:hypothetical protein [Nitrosomonas sp. PY1]GKS68166.1 hypothetical protein W03_01700 [Nitrosomonas sp. PY1]